MSGSREGGVEANRPAQDPEGEPTSLLAVWTTQTANVCRLDLRGDLCAETIAGLERHVDLLAFSGCREVVLDLAEVARLDEVGAHVLVGIGHYILARGATFRFENASAPQQIQMDRAREDMSQPPPMVGAPKSAA